MGCLLPGRFFLGLGTGENLNEHIMGQHWSTNATRQAMLADAVALIRCLWKGGQQSYEGEYYRVQNAQIFDLPDPLPPILIAVGGDHSAQLAGRLGDGYVGVGLARTRPGSSIRTAAGASRITGR